MQLVLCTAVQPAHCKHPSSSRPTPPPLQPQAQGANSLPWSRTAWSYPGHCQRLLRHTAATTTRRVPGVTRTDLEKVKTTARNYAHADNRAPECTELHLRAQPAAHEQNTQLTGQSIRCDRRPGSLSPPVGRPTRPMRQSSQLSLSPAACGAPGLVLQCNLSNKAMFFRHTRPFLERKTGSTK